MQSQQSFGDETRELHVSDRHILVKVEGLVDWTAFDASWPRLYSAVGKPSANPLVCFKLRLLAQRHDLSEPQCEAQSADRLSFRRFLGLSLADTIPDETVLVRFRQRLLKAGIAEERFTTVRARMEAAGAMIQRGALVDATIVQSARKPPARGKSGDDREARWAVKNGKPVAHGFKAPIAADDGSEIVRAIITTSGAVHDATPADTLIERAPAAAVYADAAYGDGGRRKRLRPAGSLPARRRATTAGPRSTHRCRLEDTPLAGPMPLCRPEEERVALYLAGHRAQPATRVATGRMSGQAGRSPSEETETPRKTAKIPNPISRFDAIARQIQQNPSHSSASARD